MSVVEYLREKYSCYDGRIPVQFVSYELLMDEKKTKKLLNRILGKNYWNKTQFISAELLAKVLDDDIHLLDS